MAAVALPQPTVHAGLEKNQEPAPAGVGEAGEAVQLHTELNQLALN